MPLTAAASRWLSASSLCLLMLASCGHHAHSTAAKNSINPNGIAIDGSTGSLDAHPAACTSCTVPGVNNNIAGCATVIGTVQSCEGFCFVDPSVQPSWHNEPPSSGPAYPTYEFVGQHLGISGAPPDPNANFHPSTSPLPRGNYVHGLAHGFVTIAYNCPNGCQADLDRIALIYNQFKGGGMYVTPDPALKGSTFAAISFGWVYPFNAVDPAALTCFVHQHQGFSLASHIHPSSPTPGVTQ